MRPKGDIVGDMVFGANDGIVTTFAVVAGVIGASLSSSVVIIMGLANLIADGISMAVGDYLGRKSEKEVEEYQNHTKTSINPSHNAGAIFIAFVSSGIVPLIPYLIGVEGNVFPVSVACTALALFAVGSLRTLATGRRWWVSGFEVLLVGTLAAGAAYVVGYLLKNLV